MRQAHLRSPCAHPRLGWVLVKAASEKGELESDFSAVAFSRQASTKLLAS